MSDGFVRKKVESLTLGEKLVKLRSQYRMSLAEIAKATRIQAKYLEALESGDYRELPAEVYVRGFLRNYARYLGLEDEAFIKLYDKEKHIRTHLGHEEPRHERPTIVLQKTWVITPRTLMYVGVAVLLGTTVWYLLGELHSFVAEPRLTIMEPNSGLVTKEGAVRVIGQTDTGAQVTINDQSVFVATDGKFQEMLTLQPGSNTLRIRATNRFDRTKETVLTVESEASSSQESAVAPTVEIGVDRLIDRITLEVDGVVLWNGPWNPEKRETVTVQNTLSLSSSSPTHTSIRVNQQNPQMLNALGDAPNAEWHTTRVELEEKPQPKPNISPGV